jgi:hypothetical protein
MAPTMVAKITIQIMVEASGAMNVSAEIDQEAAQTQRAEANGSEGEPPARDATTPARDTRRPDRLRVTRGGPAPSSSEAPPAGSNLVRFGKHKGHTWAVLRGDVKYCKWLRDHETTLEDANRAEMKAFRMWASNFDLEAPRGVPCGRVCLV